MIVGRRVTVIRALKRAISEYENKGAQCYRRYCAESSLMMRTRLTVLSAGSMQVAFGGESLVHRHTPVETIPPH